MAELQGKDVTIQVSTDSGTTYKTLICLETLTVDMSSDVNERTTRCGTKVGVSEPKATMTGTFVWDDAPSTAQVSGADMLTWKNNNTQVLVKAVHTTPSKLYIQASSYLTSLSLDAPSDDVLSGNFTFNLTGTIDITA